MNYRIESSAAFATIALQVAVTIATGSALAGVIAAAALVVILGPTFWRRGDDDDMTRALALAGVTATLGFSGLFVAAVAGLAVNPIIL